MNKLIPVTVAIVGLVAIGLLAIYKGINGGMIGIIVASIASLGGYHVKKRVDEVELSATQERRSKRYVG